MLAKSFGPSFSEDAGNPSQELCLVHTLTFRTVLNPIAILFPRSSSSLARLDGGSDLTGDEDSQDNLHL